MIRGFAVTQADSRDKHQVMTKKHFVQKKKKSIQLKDDSCTDFVYKRLRILLGLFPVWVRAVTEGRAEAKGKQAQLEVMIVLPCLFWSVNLSGNTEVAFCSICHQHLIFRATPVNLGQFSPFLSNLLFLDMFLDKYTTSSNCWHFRCSY